MDILKLRSLCFTYAGKKGVEIIRSYPEILSRKEIRKIKKQCIPRTSKGGEFFTFVFDNYIVASYVFTIPISKKEKLASFTAVYEEEEIHQDIVNDFFQQILGKLKTNDLLDFENIANALPDIYKEMRTGHFDFKVKTSVLIEIEDTSKNKKKNEANDENSIEDFNEDIWKNNSIFL